MKRSPWAASGILIVLAIISMSGCTVSDVKFKYAQGLEPKVTGDWRDYPVVQSLQPTLRWQPTTEEYKDAAIVSYDVAVFLAPEDDLSLKDTLLSALYQKLGDPIYSKQGVVETQHTIETPLKPDTKYVWTVRARTKKGDAENVTPWASYDGKVSKHYFLYSESATVHDAYFNFRTPAK